MKCPHCLENFHETWHATQLGNDESGAWQALHTNCPNCKKKIIKLLLHTDRMESEEWIVHPKATSRSPLSPDVPENFAQDYREACLVLADSAKASAALSRRCLQTLLREKAEVSVSDLSKEIDQVLESRTLPTHLADAIDAVRNIGNFAAHPIKSKNTGEIVEVEPGEAEWLLDVLEGLFDFYFVQPALLQRKKDALNKKLEDAGKPPMK